MNEIGKALQLLIGCTFAFLMMLFFNPFGWVALLIILVWVSK